MHSYVYNFSDRHSCWTKRGLEMCRFPLISNDLQCLKHEQFAMCSMYHLICRQLPGLYRLVVVLCGNRGFNMFQLEFDYIFDWYRSRLEFDLGRLKLFTRSISSVDRPPQVMISKDILLWFCGFVSRLLPLSGFFLRLARHLMIYDDLWFTSI